VNRIQSWKSAPQYLHLIRIEESCVAIRARTRRMSSEASPASTRDVGRTLVQLRILKLQEAALSGGLVEMVGMAAGTSGPRDEVVRSSFGHALLTVRIRVPTALPLSA